jgi:multiple sugar transport system ATP-binding protein
MQLGLRPEALRLTQSAPRLTGRVVHFENLGSEVFAQVSLDSDGSRVTLRALPAQRQALGLGAQVGLTFDLRAAMMFDAEGTRLRRVELAASRTPEVA